MENLAVRLLKFLFITISTFVILLSCDKNNPLEDSVLKQKPEILIPTTARQVDENSSRISYSNSGLKYENLARDVAKMLTSKRFRNFLKDEASKQFDGDYDILVREHLDQFPDVQNLLEEVPNLNIGFNELINTWDSENSSVLVATRVGIEDNSSVLIGFDENGKKYEIDAKIEPDKPIMVIGYNERIILDETGKFKAKEFTNPGESINTNSKMSYLCTYPFRSGPASYEKLLGMAFSDLSYYEPWYDFKPEISFRIYAPSQGNNFASVGKINEQSYSPERSSVNDSWWFFTTPLFIWYTPQYTTTMIYEFLEIDDSGQSSTVTVGLSQTYGIGSNNSSGTPNVTGSVTPSTGFSYTKKAQDIVIGRHTVEMLYCPPNADKSYQFGAGSSAFYYRAGYNY